MAWWVWMIAAVPGAVLGPPPPTRTAQPEPVQGAAAPSRPDDTVESLTLTLPEALALGLSRDRTVKVGQHNAIAARASETAAYGVYQPQVGLGASFSRFDSARSGFQSGAAGANELREVSVSVQQLLFDSAQGLYDIYAARQGARAAEHRERRAVIEAAGRIVTDFYEVLRSQALERLAEQLLAQANEQLAAARAKFEQDRGARLDVTRADVAARNAQVDLTAARNRSRASLAQLRNDLLLPPSVALVLSEAYEVPPVTDDLALVLAAARRERPDIAAAEATLRQRRHDLTAARIARFGQVRITASYDQYLESSRNVEHEYNVGISYSLPLWDGQSTRASAVVADQNYRRSLEELQQAREQGDLEVEQAYLDWLDASARLEAAEAAAGLAAESLQQTDESFRLGVASLVDLNDARAEYARAETNRIGARYDRDLASLRLRLAIGRDPVAGETREEVGGG